MRKIQWLLFLCLPVLAYGQHKDLSISIGSRDSLYSTVLKESRPYWVYLPKNYTDGMLQSSRYPVLYLLDGNDHFHSVSGVIQFLGSYSSTVPEMIVVAIPNTDRTRDLTPTHSDSMDGVAYDWLRSSGGGNNFLSFIQSELIPHIDAAYRTMPYRIFVGHSFGGITVINALYTMPQTFNAYISIDPSLWWDNKVLLNKAKEYFLHTDLKSKSLFIAQANTLSAQDSSNQHFESIKEFATYLETRNHSGLKWNYKYYEHDNHGSVPLIATYDGLRFIFQDYPSGTRDIVNPEQLRKKYQVFSEQIGGNFIPPEGVINSLGYQAMGGKKYDVALQYFQMNIDYYPQSANVYDSMGELWMKKGDSKKAIDYYERSLKLNPHNENAKMFIRKMKEELKKGK